MGLEGIASTSARHFKPQKEGSVLAQLYFGKGISMLLGHHRDGLEADLEVEQEALLLISSSV